MKTLRLLMLFGLLAVGGFAQTFDDFSMPAAVPLPDPKIQFLDANGNPLALGKVYFYIAGTDTPQDTYTSSAGSSKNTNPVILDAAGRADIWIKGEAYKIIVQNAAGVQQWTADNVTDTTFFYLEHLRAITDSSLLGYSAIVGGSVPDSAYQRSVQAKLSDIVSTRDFGAVADGSAHAVQGWCTNHSGTRYTAANDAACLAAIQADYSFVAAISEDIDLVAMEAANRAVHAAGGGVIVVPYGAALGNPDTFETDVQWIDLRPGTVAAPHTATDSRLPNIYLKRFDNTHEITGSGDISGLPPWGSTLRVETTTGDNSADRNWGIASLIFENTKPIAFPLGPVSANVAGYFWAVSDAGGNAVKGITALNPMVQWDARPSGTVNTSGTAVTKASGTDFDSSWEHSTIDINNVAYEIASVESTTGLTLVSSAGSQTGAAFIVGGAIYAIEADVNNRWADVSKDSAVSYNGIGIVSGHDHKPLTGLTVQSTQGATNAWRYGATISDWTEKGIYLINPRSATAVGLQIDGASAQYAIKASGTTLLDGKSGGLLVLTPSDDVYASIIYGTTADGDDVLWSVAKTGLWTTPGIVFSPDNNATAGPQLMFDSAGIVRLTPQTDAPTDDIFRGTDAKGSTIKWSIKQNGNFSTAALSSTDVTTSGSVTVGTRTGTPAAYACFDSDGKLVSSATPCVP